MSAYTLLTNKPREVFSVPSTPLNTQSLPSEIGTALSEYYSSATSILGDALEGFITVGSCAKGEAIDNWSDIDVLLITDYPTDKAAKLIAQSLSSPTQKVKVGIKYCSSIELQIPEALDGQVLQSLVLINTKTLLPQYQKDSLAFATFSSQEVLYTSCELGHAIHQLRRGILDYYKGTTQPIRGIVKNGYHTAKLIARYCGINIETPEEIQGYFKDFSSHFELPISLPDIQKVITNEYSPEQLYDINAQIVDVLVSFLKTQKK